MIGNAALGVALGLWSSMLGTGSVAAAYGIPLGKPWQAMALVRLLGLVLLAFGLLCWMFRDAAEPLRHQVAGTLFGFFSLACLVALGQQLAIWNRPTGWLTVAVLGLDGLAFGAFFFQGSRAGGRRLRPPAAQPTTGGHANAARF
jgi:hypothetical protein